METKKSLQRILTELKTINKKIEDKTNNLNVIGVTKGDKFLENMSVEDFINTAKADIQQVEDLIERRFALKRALLSLNATTKVVINNKEYTIAEAIEYKTNIIKLKGQLLSKLRTLYKFASQKFELTQRDLEGQLTKLIESSFSNKDNKANADDIKTITDAFNKANGVKYVDPLNVLEYIKTLDEEIRLFTCEIDSILSETNATTIATV